MRAKIALTLMPSPRATRGVVHRGAQPAAEAGARQDELQARPRAAPQTTMMKQAVEADATPEDLDPALQPGRQPDELLLRAHRVVDARPPP